jgi:hypothetical protein
MLSVGKVISRNATTRVTSRKRLTATLRIVSAARRRFRTAFFNIKLLMVTTLGPNKMPILYRECPDAIARER